jgi:hypothetical protein
MKDTYKSKIIYVEAFRFLKKEDWREACNFCDYETVGETTNGIEECDPDFLDILTENGWVEAVPPCFILKKENGDLSVMNDEEFLKNYELVKLQKN